MEYRPPRGALQVALIAGFMVVGTAAIGLYSGLLGSQQPAWFVVAFELVTLLAGAFVVLVGRGRFAAAPGLALLCCAGAIGAGTYLAHIGSGKQVLAVWFLLLRAGLSGVLLAAAAWSVLARNPGPAVRSLTRAALFGVPLLAMLAGLWLLRHQVMALPGTVKMLGAMFGFLVVAGLAAGAVHCTIRAFEVCDEDPSLR